MKGEAVVIWDTCTFRSGENVKDDLLTLENQSAEYIEMTTCEMFYPFILQLHRLIP